MIKMYNKKLERAKQESAEGKDLSNVELNKITREYQQQINIPKQKIKPQIILCSVGLVGAGKTTILKAISKKLGLIKISSDEIRKLLKTKDFNFIRTIDIVKKIMENYLNQGFSLAMDGDAITPEIQKYVNKFASNTIKIVWIHVKAPEKIILDRLQNRNHTGLFKNTHDEINNYRRRKPLHRHYLSMINFYYKFDTSKKDINKQINKFICKLKSDYYLSNN